MSKSIYNINYIRNTKEFGLQNLPAWSRTGPEKKAFLG
jgi:hypothetical protein